MRRKERNQCENRQARAQAKLMAIAVSQALQSQNSKWETKFNYLPESKTSKGNYSNANQQAAGIWKNLKKAFPGPVTKHRDMKKWYIWSPKGSGTSALGMALLDVWAAQGLSSSPMRWLSHWEPWMVLDVADDKISVWSIQEPLLCPDLSHWVTFIQKLCCDCSYGKSHTHYFTGSLIANLNNFWFHMPFLLCLSVLLHHQEESSGLHLRHVMALNITSQSLFLDSDWEK